MQDEIGNERQAFRREAGLSPWQPACTSGPHCPEILAAIARGELATDGTLELAERVRE
jgi:hypothetical protein